MKKVLLLISLVPFFAGHASELRSEVDRFKLLSDRHAIDQEIRGIRKYNSYASLDITLSSGLRKIVNDISDATEGDQSDAQKDLAVYKVLTQNLNTDKFIYLDVMAGAPLPYFKVGKWAFLPNLFMGINAGANLTIHNTVDALNPEAQTYLKIDKLLGIQSKIKWNSEEQLTVRGYYLMRQDLSANASYTEISDDGEIVSTDDLDKTLNTAMLDLAWDRQTSNHSFLLELKEIRLYKLSNSTTNGNYGSTPLIHGRYGRKVHSELLQMTYSAGAHLRSGYDLNDGIYALVDLDFAQQAPFGFSAKIDRDFISFMPRANFNHFHFSYELQTAFRNPQEDIWASSIHSLAISAPF